MSWFHLFHIFFGAPVKVEGCPVGPDLSPFWDYYDDDFECV